MDIGCVLCRVIQNAKIEIRLAPIKKTLSCHSTMYCDDGLRCPRYSDMFEMEGLNLQCRIHRGKKALHSILDRRDYLASLFTTSIITGSKASRKVRTTDALRLF